jgi:hypothetical protein
MSFEDEGAYPIQFPKVPQNPITVVGNVTFGPLTTLGPRPIHTERVVMDSVYILRVIPRHGSVRLLAAATGTEGLERLKNLAFKTLQNEKEMAHQDYNDNHLADSDFYDEPPIDACYELVDWQPEEFVTSLIDHSNPAIKQGWIAHRACLDNDDCVGFCNSYDIIELQIE